MTRDELKKELDGLWKERKEVEETKDETDDPFVPAKECKMDANTALIHIEL